MGEKMAVIQEIEVLKKALMEHDRTAMEGAIKGCIDAGIDAEDVVCAIQEQMCVVGTMFEKGRLFLPQMIAIAGAEDLVPFAVVGYRYFLAAAGVVCGSAA